MPAWLDQNANTTISCLIFHSSSCIGTKGIKGSKCSKGSKGSKGSSLASVATVTNPRTTETHCFHLSHSCMSFFDCVTSNARVPSLAHGRTRMLAARGSSSALSSASVRIVKRSYATTWLREANAVLCLRPLPPSTCMHIARTSSSALASAARPSSSVFSSTPRPQRGCLPS